MTADRTPTTEAGRALLARWGADATASERDAIFAIEAEARQPDGETLRLLQEVIFVADYVEVWGEAFRMNDRAALDWLGPPPAMTPIINRIRAYLAAHPAPEEKP